MGQIQEVWGWGGGEVSSPKVDHEEENAASDLFPVQSMGFALVLSQWLSPDLC